MECLKQDQLVHCKVLDEQEQEDPLLEIIFHL